MSKTFALLISHGVPFMPGLYNQLARANLTRAWPMLVLPSSCCVRTDRANRARSHDMTCIRMHSCVQLWT